MEAISVVRCSEWSPSRVHLYYIVVLVTNASVKEIGGINQKIHYNILLIK